MRIAVIGGKGHIGTYLVPRLVTDGHEVICISRGLRSPYTSNKIWRYVEQVILDREAEDKLGTFGQKIGDLKPDVVVDLINFNFASTEQMVQSLQGKIMQYLYCGSIWAHGAATVVPAVESLPRRPICDYGKDKYKSESYLLDLARRGQFPATIVMPGHITGPGWTCINPCGNFDPLVFERISKGEVIYIPHFGMETLHHVHADDVAQVFQHAIIHMTSAVGESFHAVAPHAITLRGLAEAVAAWFGREPNIQYLPWKEWCEAVGREDYINSTYSHIAHSDNYSIQKAVALLEYAPRYSIVQAVKECVDSMILREIIHV